jgi:hypothetical protein
MGSAVLRTLATGALLAILGLPASFANAQDEGDTVLLKLKSGKSFEGVLVSRDDTNVKIRIGDSEIDLPADFVESVERIAEPEPPPSPPADPGPAPDSNPGVPAVRSPYSRDAAPAVNGGTSDALRGASLLLKDGTLIEGFVVKKENGKYWIVPGKPVEVEADDVAEAFGDTEPKTGIGPTLTGDANADAAKLVLELASGDNIRAATAAAVLEKIKDQATPALVAGLKMDSKMARQQCLSYLGTYRPKEAVGPILEMLRSDPDLDIRRSVVSTLSAWDPPGARRALLEAAWRDRSEAVKVAALYGLEAKSGPEEASALIDLLSIYSEDFSGRPQLFKALRKATGQKFDDTNELWLEWWNEKGGREENADQAQALAERRLKDEATRAQWKSEQENNPKPPEVPMPTPADEQAE